METKQHDIFTLVKTDKNKIKIVCGNNLMTNKSFEDYKKAKDYLKSKPYEIIINLIHLVLEYEKEKTNKVGEEPTNKAETNK